MLVKKKKIEKQAIV